MKASPSGFIARAGLGKPVADRHADDRGHEHLAVDGREEPAQAHRAMLLKKQSNSRIERPCRRARSTITHHGSTPLSHRPARALRCPAPGAQSAPASLKVSGLSQLTLTVSDVEPLAEVLSGPLRHADSGAPGHHAVPAHRHGPQFLRLKQAAAGERPSISAFGMGVEDFSIDRVLRVLEQNGVTRATATPPRRSR
jgi:hypothetical protein